MCWTFDAEWRLVSPYFGGPDAVFTEAAGVPDYVAASGPALARSGFEEGVTDFKNPHRAHGFRWTIADVVSALLDVGLSLTALREYPYANGCRILPGMRTAAGGRVLPPEGLPSLPLRFGLRAERA